MRTRSAHVRRCGLIGVGAGLEPCRRSPAAGRRAARTEGRVRRLLGHRAVLVLPPGSGRRARVWPRRRTSARDVRAARRRADVVVATFHWGVERSRSPSRAPGRVRPAGPAGRRRRGDRRASARAAAGRPPVAPPVSRTASGTSCGRRPQRRRRAPACSSSSSRRAASRASCSLQPGSSPRVRGCSHESDRVVVRAEGSAPKFIVPSRPARSASAPPAGRRTATGRARPLLVADLEHAPAAAASATCSRPRRRCARSRSAGPSAAATSPNTSGTPSAWPPVIE